MTKILIRYVTDININWIFFYKCYKNYDETWKKIKIAFKLELNVAKNSKVAKDKTYYIRVNVSNRTLFKNIEKVHWNAKKLKKSHGFILETFKYRCANYK